MYAAPDSQISQCFVTEASAVTTICGQIVLRLRKLRWRQQFAIARVNSEYTRRNWVPNSNHGLVIIKISLGNKKQENWVYYRATWGNQSRFAYAWAWKPRFAPLIWTESPNRYYATDVNIHFKTPIRHEQRQNVPEEELAIRQAEHMQKLYHEERRRKYLQELQDMNSRRHTDNFTPSQKSPIALNRYDDFPTDVTLKSLVGPKTVARALFNFQGQSSKCVQI